MYDVLSSNWVCGSDQDTTLTESEVRTMMEGASGLSLNLTSTSNVDGASILTSDTTLEVDWNNINNRPTGLDDGDDVTNALDALGCSQGQIPMKGDTVGNVRSFPPYWTMMEMVLYNGTIVMTVMKMLEINPMMPIVMVQ